MPDEDDFDRPFRTPYLAPYTKEEWDADIAKRRREDPPINCWLDAPLRVDLFVEGKHRAQIDRAESLISVLDGEGGVARSFIYLRSENPYDVTESNLGIPRIEEVRDESDQSFVNPDRRPREEEDRNATDFQARYYAEEEIMHYLWSAAWFVRGDLTGAQKVIQQNVQQSIIALVMTEYEKALSLAKAAVDTISAADSSRFFLPGWHRHCAQAVVALERFIELKNRRGIKRSPKPE